MRIRITVAYDGRAFEGWQVQPGKRTVQDTLSAALTELYAEEIRVVGAGRTDTGVHATGQVAHFDVVRCRVPVGKLVPAIRHLLPRDILVREAVVAADDFHACFGATSRRYRYSFVTGCLFPHERGIATFWPYGEPDPGRIHEILAPLEGEHDFTSFSLKDCDAKTRIRTFRPVVVERTPRGFDLVFTANGFLRRMIRMIVGQLVASWPLADGPAEVRRVLLAGNNAACAAPAPPDGLYLEKIEF